MTFPFLALGRFVFRHQYNHTLFQCCQQLFANCFEREERAGSPPPHLSMHKARRSGVPRCWFCCDSGEASGHPDIAAVFLVRGHGSNSEADVWQPPLVMSDTVGDVRWDTVWGRSSCMQRISTGLNAQGFLRPSGVSPIWLASVFPSNAEDFQPRLCYARKRTRVCVGKNEKAVLGDFASEDE